MADIFQEVDEEVRRERLKQIWDRYGILIIAAAVLIVAGVAGYRGYQYWQAKQAAAASAKFEQAVDLAEQPNKSADAHAAFAKLAADAPAGYRTLARLRAAQELAKTDKKAAVAAYDAIAADSAIGQGFQDAAALRAGMLLVDTAPLDEMKRRLDPLSEPGRAFRHTAREMLALAAWRNGDAASAKKYIEQANNDAETPPGVRSRLEVLSAVLAAGGKG